MNKVVVVDACLALKWVLPENDTDIAIMLLDTWANEGIEVIAPDLFAYEVTNILYRRIRAKERANKCGPRVNRPIMIERIAFANTAPAATSLAIFARGWYWGEARSMHNSITVLNISAMKTPVIAIKISANSTGESWRRMLAIITTRAIMA
jgi:hypothetical protein